MAFVPLALVILALLVPAVPSVDINECALPVPVCQVDEICVNTQNSFYCLCKDGFEKVDGICKDKYACYKDEIKVDLSFFTTWRLGVTYDGGHNFSASDGTLKAQAGIINGRSDGEPYVPFRLKYVEIEAAGFTTGGSTGGFSIRKNTTEGGVLTDSWPNFVENRLIQREYEDALPQGFYNWDVTLGGDVQPGTGGWFRFNKLSACVDQASATLQLPDDVQFTCVRNGHYEYPGSAVLFIQCDDHGQAFVRSCPHGNTFHYLSIGNGFCGHAQGLNAHSPTLSAN